MAIRELLFLVFTVLGGLALFIFGMNIMTEGLRLAAGAKLQRLLARATRGRASGYALGTGLGSLVHSSASTVMLVGFVNAGLMSLEQSIAPMLGANLGTTVSMQAISLKLGDYCFFAIALGFLFYMAAPSPKARQLGRAFLGFGLLFLGMETMSGAIKPHRELLAPFLAGIDGGSLHGLLIGVGISAGLTAIWQSSGATIAILFALISAGVFTDLQQVFPIVLGAHIGTCATALLGSIGTNIEARRCALAHLFFNIGNVALAIVARNYFFKLVPLTASDLTHQTANLHTAVMLVAGLAVLPVAPLYGKLVRCIVVSRSPRPEPSHLDPELVAYPEKALVAVIQELQRLARICARSFHLSAHVLIRDYDRRTVVRIKLNEKVINEIKQAVREYLSSITRHYLSRRQTVLMQHLNRCMIDIERIGDHIDQLCDLSLRRHKVPAAMVDRASLEQLFALYRQAERVLRMVIDSLDAERKDFQSTAAAILAARDQYIAASMETKAAFSQKIVEHKVTPIAAMYYTEYVAVFDRIVRHAKTIALAQTTPDFWIKRRKLEVKAREAEDVEVGERIDPKDFLDKLQREDYL